MKKILLISFFRSSNIGDNAIAAVLQRELSSIAVVSTMDISGRPVKLVTDVQGRGAQSALAAASKCRLYTLKSILALRKWDRFSHAEQMIAQADLVLIAGGNMVMDMEPFSFYSYLCQRYVSYAKASGKNVAFAFVGVGRIRTRLQRWRWRRVLGAAKLVSVRDSLARQLLHEKVGCQRDILVWKDPVFLLEARNAPTAERAVGINIYLGAATRPEQRAALKAAYLFWARELSRNHDVVLYTTEHMDEPGLEEVYAALEDKSRVSKSSPRNLDELLSLYQRLDIAITTRMHAFIIAATQGIPTLMLSWDKKINGVAEDIGMAAQVYGVRTVAKKQADILAAAHGMLERREEYAARTTAACRSIRESFDTYIQSLKELAEEV